MIIDCHTHVFPPEFVAQREKLARVCRWFGLLYANPKRKMATAEQLLASMKRSGVDRAVAFGFPWSDAGRLRAANDYVADAAAGSDGRLIPFAVVNPAKPELTEGEIVRLHGRGLRGIGELMPDGQDFRIDDEKTVDFETKDHKISIRMECDLCRPLGISTWCTAATIRNVRLRNLSPEEAKPAPPKE